jgi:D-beta-D-heptose 7-phosphate kinase/D-beta-D-heptose 1-phosphate adenosyltransferase
MELFMRKDSGNPENTVSSLPADLLERLQNMPSYGVLVVGDLMLDRFIYGEVHRISPESPVPVLNITREEQMLGGAGNVLSNLAGIGIGRHLIGVIGDDDAGIAVRQLVKDRGASAAALIVAHDRPTTVKSRFLAGHQQMLRADIEKKTAIGVKTQDEIFAQAEKLIGSVQAMVLSDYGKGALPPALIAKLIGLAQKNKVKVLVDPKGSDYKIYSGADVVTPNRKELAEACNGAPVKSDAEIESAACDLIKRSGIKNIVATRSQDGMSVIGAKDEVGAPVHLETEALEVFDVSGAGDTVIATVAAALAAGADIVSAAKLANMAGGIVVAKVGTAPVRHEELAERLGGGGGKRQARLVGYEQAQEEVKRWRARGLKVGFTNGCFDILHVGHIAYLTEARAQCDRLIVAVNADDSVRRLKGPTRPVNGEQARAAVIAALGPVDMVVVFGRDEAEKDTPCDLIAKLKPDIFFKGGDYTIERLPEAAIVQGYGGQVKLLTFHEGNSTTSTIAKMQGAG